MIRKPYSKINSPYRALGNLQRQQRADTKILGSQRFEVWPLGTCDESGLHYGMSHAATAARPPAEGAAAHSQKRGTHSEKLGWVRLSQPEDCISQFNYRLESYTARAPPRQFLPWLAKVNCKWFLYSAFPTPLEQPKHFIHGDCVMQCKG